MCKKTAKASGREDLLRWIEDRKSWKAPVHLFGFERWSREGNLSGGIPPQDLDERYKAYRDALISGDAPLIVEDARAQQLRGDPYQLFAHSKNQSITIPSDGTSLHRWVGLRCWQLNVGSGALELESAWIGELRTIHFDAVKLTDCWIADLGISPDRRLEIRGGGCLSFESYGDRMRHAVQIDRTFQFPARSDEFFPTSQPFKNFRHALIEAGNARVAGIVWRGELRFARQSEDKSFDRLLSRAYAVLSDYGTSRGRPAAVAFACFAASAATAYYSDSTAVGSLMTSGVDAATAGKGLAVPDQSWQLRLADPGNGNRFWRSVIYGFSTVANPFGIIGSVRPVVYVKEPWVAAVTSILGALGTLALGFFVASVRRRFKLDG